MEGLMGRALEVCQEHLRIDVDAHRALHPPPQQSASRYLGLWELDEVKLLDTAGETQPGICTRSGGVHGVDFVQPGEETWL